MTRTRSRIFAFTILLALLISGAAAAQKSATGLYVSAKWGKTDVEASIGDLFDSVLDGDDDTQAYEVGWRFNNLVAVQAGYHDLGNLPGTTMPCLPDLPCQPVIVPIEAKTIAYSLSFVPQLPLTRSLFLFVKVGVVALETDVSITDETSDFVQNLSDEDLIYGAGLRLRLFAGLSAFYEYEFLGSDLETQSLGLTYLF